MNWDTIKGDWNQMKGKVKEKWAKLAHDDLTAMEGERDELIGIIQKTYGIAREEAEKQVSEFQDSL